MTFEEWFHDYEWSPEKEAWGQAVWNAAQKAERERIKQIIHEATDGGWGNYELLVERIENEN